MKPIGLSGWQKKKMLTDKQLVDEIIDLRKRLAETERQRDNALAYITPLREALRFYASKNSWKEQIRYSSMGDYEASDIEQDQGAYARQALGEE